MPTAQLHNELQVISLRITQLGHLYNEIYCEFQQQLSDKMVSNSHKFSEFVGNEMRLAHKMLRKVLSYTRKWKQEYQIRKILNQVNDEPTRQSLLSLNDLAIQNPDRSELYFDRGCFIQNKFKQYQLAEQDYRRCLELDPRDKLAINNVGYIQGAIYNDKPEALRVFFGLLKLDPTNHVALSNIGHGYVEMEEYEKALHYFEKAIRLNQNFKEAYYGMGLAYQNMGLNEEAEKQYINALKIDPQYIMAQKQKALLQKKLREKSMCEEESTADANEGSMECEKL